MTAEVPSTTIRGTAHVAANCCPTFASRTTQERKRHTEQKRVQEDRIQTFLDSCAPTPMPPPPPPPALRNCLR